MAMKSVHEYLSKIKIANQFRQHKLLKTPSYREGGKDVGDNDATLDAVDRFMFENFRSLYQQEYEEQLSAAASGPPTPVDSPLLLGSPPRENLCASSRFFVSSGSTSSRIVDEAAARWSSGTNGPSPAAEDADCGVIAAPRGDYVAILVDSQQPYDDFRRSMEEMVEARSALCGGVDWEFLEELLFGYLDLNEKKSYVFILRAFVDTIVNLRKNSGAGISCRPP